MWCYQEGMILQNVCYIYDDIFNIFIVFRAIHNMNTWYPDATPEELENTDNVCIICREEMQAPSTKKLPCNHIFHKNCLRSWFQRQQTCPTCRLDVLRCFRILIYSSAHFATFRYFIRAPIPGQRQRNQRQQQPQQQQQAQPQQGQAAQPQPQQAAQQPPNVPNMNQMFAQLMAANARLQFPPATPAAAPVATTTASNVSTGKVKCNQN